MKSTALTTSQAAARKAHFAAGGTTAMWQGRPATLDGAKSKARQSKMACRRRNRSED